MIRIGLILCSLVLLVACATAPYGVMQNVQLSQPLTSLMSESSAQKLSELYPPAQNPLSLSYPTQDSFGATLVSLLRKKGYAISEKAANASDKEGSSDKKTVSQQYGKPFRYVIDRIDNGVLRLTMNIGSTTLSRAYVNSTKPYAVGSWAVME